MPKIDLDKINLVSRDLAARAANKALRPIQSLPPEEQVAGVAVLFAAWCQRLALDPEDMHRKALRMIREEPHHQQANVHMEVLRDFAGLRLAQEQDVVIA